MRPEILRSQPRLLAAVLLVAATLVPLASPAARAAITGSKMPSIGLNPHYSKIGKAEPNATTYAYFWE